MGSSKAMTARSEQLHESQRAPLAPAVTALLDHIAEDLAREYAHLMESAAQHDNIERLPSPDANQEARDAGSDLRQVQLREPAPREH